MTQKEINVQFEQEPDFEVSEFKIYRDGMLDRRALFQARTARVAAVIGQNLAFVGSRMVDSIDELVYRPDEFSLFPLRMPRDK
jgi:hypothetical protein